MEQSLLERELEKANLPPNYNQDNSYSREQQFQADVVNRLAEKSFDYLVDLKGLVVENCERRIDGQYILRVHINPEEVKKYVQSALYKRAVNRLTARIRNAALRSDFLDNITTVNNALNELKYLLSLRPYIFKKVYQDCFQNMEETAKPLLALVGLTEEMLLEEPKGGLPPCQEEWDSEYTECVNHFEQLE